MTVRELIEKLRHLPPELPVLVQGDDEPRRLSGPFIHKVVEDDDCNARVCEKLVRQQVALFHVTPF